MEQRELKQEDKEDREIDAMPIPDGVDLSEPINIQEQAEMPVMPAIISSDEDLITVITARLIEMTDTHPFYKTFIDDLSNQATIKWYRKGDFEMIRMYVTRNLVKVLNQFPDLRDLKISIAKDRIQSNRKKRKALKRKAKKKSGRRA